MFIGQSHKHITALMISRALWILSIRNEKKRDRICISQGTSCFAQLINMFTKGGTEHYLAFLFQKCPLSFDYHSFDAKSCLLLPRTYRIDFHTILCVLCFHSAPCFRPSWRCCWVCVCSSCPEGPVSSCLWDWPPGVTLWLITARGHTGKLLEYNARSRTILFGDVS